MYAASLTFAAAVMAASLAFAQAPAENGAPAPLTNPSLAFNLAGVNDWSTEYPFIDLFKMSREWIGHLPGQWGGVSPEAMAAATDAHGWLTRMPAGAERVSALILTSFPEEMVSAKGRFHLLYQGKGKLEVRNVQTVSDKPGEIVFDYRPNGSNMVDISISAIDESDPLRAFHVVHERDLDAFRRGEIFNPKWLGLVHDLRLFRFMDWMRTNDSALMHWSERAHPEDATWTTGKGVPLEVMVELANLTGTDPWFTIPHLADDDYTAQFASYVRDHLDPKLKPWFEYSNEVWNWQFGQAQWANQQGRALWPDNGTAWVEYYAGKATDMADVLDRVYGPEGEQRMVKVISTQTGWIGLEDAVLNAPAWQKSGAGRSAPSGHFNAYAITGYFDGGLGRDGKPKVVKEWLAQSRTKAEADADAQGLSRIVKDRYVEAHRYDQAGALAIRELRDGSVTGNEDGSLKALFKTFAYHRDIAQKYGLELVMYEGGSHVVGVGPWQDDEELTGFFTWLNRSVGMGELYAELLAGWKDNGGTLFNAFADIAMPGKYGSWGKLNHIDDDTPRWEVLMRFNRETPAWWENRPADTFLGTLETAAP
ncbi:hypothetical protein [Paracoccus aminophilus]|uniref:Cellulose-binding domain protein n=1 Tax=Paracoccus aminophilus JCM 7686 TaxID=1367847 RepID=S5XNY3_PARAH|nr:hypothetical protein [Paracoccus aminophilus]AGT09029.1 hypothetical protein JCM7686_1928 [Paracoccus aminophilus JCM 7686]